MNHSLRVLLTGAAFAALALIALPQPAEACGNCWVCDVDGRCWWQCEASLQAVGGDRAILSINQYVSEEMDEEGACATSLDLGQPGGKGTILSVKGVTMIEQATGAPIAGYRFEQHPRPAEDFASLAAEAGVLAPGRGHFWTGFFTPVHERVEGGIVTSLVFDLQLRKGATLEAVARQLRRNGILGTGSANPDGSLDTGHGHHMILPLRYLDFSVVHSGEPEPDKASNLESPRQ